MSPKKLTKIPISEYSKIHLSEHLEDGKIPPVYRLVVHPNFSPIDINIQFLIEEGWSDADRLRFWTEMDFEVEEDQPQAVLVANFFEPNLIIRRYDREEDALLHIRISKKGEIQIVSNDRDFAQRYLRGLFLEFPPSFYSTKDLEVHEGWVEDQQVCAMFLGMLHGALGWSSSH